MNILPSGESYVATDPLQSSSIYMAPGLHLNCIWQSAIMTQKGKLAGLLIAVVAIDLFAVFLSFVA